MKYDKIQVEDCRVFYREAGNPENPTILLLHGFPSSSHMLRELMPELADEYHLIAPDFPAFGQTESPSREEFTYSFDHLARIIDKFTEAVGLTKFAMYVFDYGAPSAIVWPYGTQSASRPSSRRMATCMKKDLARNGRLARHIGSILLTNSAGSSHLHTPLKPSSGNTPSERRKVV